MILYGKDKVKILKEIRLVLKNIDYFIKHLKKHHKKKTYFQQTFPVINNNFLSSFVSFKDILLNVRIFYLCDSRDEQNLLLRTLSLNLYEFLQNLRYYFGKDFVKELKTLTDNKDIFSKIILLKKDSEDIRVTYNKKLGDIRHNTIAHKDVNAVKLTTIIETLNFDEIEEIFRRIIRLNLDIITIENQIYTKLYSSYEDFLLEELKTLKEQKNLLECTIIQLESTQNNE